MMTIKSAEEIINKYRTQMQALIPPPVEEFVPSMEFWKAQSFLELAKRVEPMVEALKKIADECPKKTEDDMCGVCSLESSHSWAKEALKLWEEIKGEK